MMLWPYLLGYINSIDRKEVKIMKKILLMLITILVLIPMTVFASEKEKYTSKNLEEVLKEEDIDADLKKYEENDEQITIYLFRGHGCAYCKKFLSFISSIVDDYGKYFKIESYEVWQDADNVKLFDSVATFLDKQAQGVPYIVIGDKVFTGFTDSYGDEIKKEIKKQYDSKDRYDVLKEMDKKEKREKFAAVFSNFIIGFNIFLTVGAITILIVLGRKNNKLLIEKIERLESKVDLLEKDIADSKNKTEKKVAKTKTVKETKKTEKASSIKKKKGETKKNEKSN